MLTDEQKQLVEDHIEMDKKRYLLSWPQISFAIKDAEGWKCQECGIQCRRPGEPFDTHRRTLTVSEEKLQVDGLTDK